jgi:hypothetical protein
MHRNLFSINTLISLAIVGSTFTQIRFSNLPIGVSDLLFLAYIVYSFGLFTISFGENYYNNKKIKVRLLIKPILVYLLLYLLLIFAGTLYSSFLLNNGSLMTPLHPDGAKLLYSPYHSILAYLYLVIIFLTLYIRADINIKLVAFYTIFWMTILVVLFYLLSLQTKNILGVNLFYVHTERLMLFTKSPNHLADFIAPLPLFLIFFLGYTKSILIKVIYTALALILFKVGLDSQSKSLILGWGLALIYFYFYYFSISKFAKYIFPVSIIMLIGFSIYIQNYYIGSIISKIQNILDAGNLAIPYSIIYDLKIRLGLFFNGLEVAKISPIFGLGVGASSGIAEPFLGRESHNHISEIIMTSGYFGILAYTALMSIVFYRLILFRNPILMGIFIVISVTTLFHMQLRQPLFWFYMLFLIYLSSDSLNINSQTSDKIE